MAPRRLSMLLFVLLLHTALSARAPNLHGAIAFRAQQPRALAQFGIVLKSARSALFAHGPVIMSQGMLSDAWNASCVESQGSNCAALHTLDAYEDVLTFEYIFSDASLYDFGTPILTSRGGRAQPVVEDYSNDVEQRAGEIRVWHNCARISAAAVREREKMMAGDAVRLREVDVSVVTMSLRLTADTTVTIGWRKVCGYGVHRHLDYGIEVRDTARSLRVKGRGVKVGPEAVSTRMYLRATDGVSAPHFLPPAVVAAKEKGRAFPLVVPLVRGWESDANGAAFYVLYACEGMGVSKISATIALPPFENATMSWEKDCGGGKEESLHILGVFDEQGEPGRVIMHGKAVNGFEKAALESEENALPHGKESVVFLITAREGTKIGPPSASSNDGRIVRAELMGRLRDGGTVGESERRIVIGVKCRKVGVARVTVTVPVLDRVPAEWAFYKRCFGPQNDRRGPRPVGMFVGAIVVLWVVYVLQKVANAVPPRKGVRFAKVMRVE